MLMYPSVRKGLITESSPTITPSTTTSTFYPDDSVHILQDDLSFSDHDLSLQAQQQPQPDFSFLSPPSSSPSSPIFSSPASSFSTNAVATDYNSNNSFLEAPSMTPSSSYNPSIQIQQANSPNCSQPYLPSQYQHQPYFFDDASMLAQQQPVANNPVWDNNMQLLSPAQMPNGIPRLDGYPESQHQQKAMSPNSSSGSSSVKDAHRDSSSSATASSKPLPTPVQTPVQNSFLATPFQHYDPSSQNGNSDAEIAMRRAIVDQQRQPQLSHQHQRSDHSLAPSVSTLSHNSPVTPQNSFDELDDASKAMATGEDLFPGVDRWMDEYLQLGPLSDYNGGNNNVTNGTGNNFSTGIPKLNRTISDIYQDELYNTAIMPASQASKKPSMNQQMLTPYRNVFADRLQAANQGHLSARSHSPGGMAINRERSPFRQNAPLAGEYNNSNLQPSTSMPMAQNGVHMPQTATNNGEPKTISPKDAMLDFNEGEDAAMPPLFSSNQPDFNLGDALGSQLRRESSSSFRPSQQAFNTIESYANQYPTAGVPQQYHFATPQPPQQQHDRRSSQQQNNLLHQTPEFPASLPSLESTGSDGFVGTEMSPPQVPQAKIRDSISRPQNTSSDSGTYTCTYHGCSVRFESPAKLQKHKREAHRQTTPGGHLISRDTSSSRNTQAGPHKCERINPSTGKPCNSVFSRPYDLTRHEDTIHNARKQKVRCHLCTEEKTFSRNDALTRHMRVVHPEVDWPGKQRRRGRE